MINTKIYLDQHEKDNPDLSKKFEDLCKKFGKTEDFLQVELPSTPRAGERFDLQLSDFPNVIFSFKVTTLKHRYLMKNYEVILTVSLK